MNLRKKNRINHTALLYGGYRGRSMVLSSDRGP